MQVNMYEAKSQLSVLGNRAWEGEKIVIAKAGKPYLALSPYKAVKEKIKVDGYEDQIPLIFLTTKTQMETYFYQRAMNCVRKIGGVGRNLLRVLYLRLFFKRN